MSEKDGSLKYISLAEAAKYSDCYSQEYLSLRARQGKLKAIKIGRNWVTTKEWIDEYLEKANNYKNQIAERKAKKIIKPIPPFPPTFQPVPRARSRALVWALIFVLASVGTLFASPYFSPLLKSVANSIKDGATEVITDIRVASAGASATLSKFTSDIEEGVVEVGDSVSENLSDFTTDISTGASLMVEKFSNKLAQRFIAGISGISDIPKELKYYLSQDIKALKVFSKKTILGISYRIKDFWNNLTYGPEGISENIIKGIRNIGKSVRYKTGQSVQLMIEGVQGFGEELKKVGQEFSYSFKKGYQYITRTILDTFKEVPEKIVEFFKKEAEKEFPEEKLLPKPEKEGVVVIPSTERDEEIKQKIKASFSDEVRVEPKDESSGIIVPIFREIEGEEYLYLMVPVKE
ncbi:hypothetical protein KJA17_02210 [Patescibacteria group bacterium]|nr:hypothetical protein [Patescibacteria group bacterium]